MKRKERPDSPSCPLSIHCLRLLDELDAPGTLNRGANEPEPSSFPGDELELLGRLRRHLSECQICSTVVDQARNERDRQRQLLRQFLEEAERRTPSTQELILQLIRSDQAQAEAASEALTVSDQVDHVGRNHHHRLPFAVLSRLPELPAQDSSFTRPARRSPLWETLVLVAVILVVLLSTGSLGYLLLRHSAPQTPTSSPPTAVSLKATYQGLAWKAVMMVDPIPDSAGRYPLYNYDPFSGQKRLLTTSCCDATSAVDGIAHSGRDLLYHQSTGKARLFRTLSQPEAIFSCSCTNPSAVWTTDDRHLLIDAGSQLFLVNLSGRSELIYSSPILQGSTLTFYYNDFLFFTRQENSQEMLYRLDLASGELRSIASRPLVANQGLSSAPSSRNAWLLSPTGSAIYYSVGHGLGATLYMVESDGSNRRALNRHGIPLGFADDNRLLFLQEAHGAFEVRKLGDTPQQDQLVVVNAAPGASSVLPDGLALAPYGWALLTEALYPDHSLRLWATNLTTHTQKLLLSVSASQMTRAGAPQLIGWDQLPVKSEATPTPSEVQIPANLSPADDWNGLLLVSSDQNGQIAVSNYNYATGHLQSLLAAMPPQTEIDGISPDGSSLAYHVPSTTHTDYYVVDLRVTPPLTRFQYHSTGSGGNAIWLDSQTLLLNAPTGMLRVNMKQAQPKVVMSSLPDSRLAFYSSPYLYFVQPINGNQEALFRLPLGSSVEKREAITPPVPRASTDFWLSPDGRTIYYVNYQSEAPGIYAVDSDGGNRHRLRPWGIPIGYAADNSLMIMRYSQGSFEVVKLGLTPAQDQVLLHDAAPGAQALCSDGTAQTQAAALDPELICESDVALAPYGHHLVVQAHYADGHASLLAYNLDNGQQLSAQTITTNRLVGYNRYPPA
ncbi:TolB family protein [Thermogemmatispora sp.]|uniref:TolB family protein n=1 Tax=Thermogemmatispora sp. TaxID=1968838 RepID=UPI001D3D0BCF|nr:hypothetical protein [Thermogemmatispora sp.]MBX5448888.1 hypothetical protein [Thermogemmatispora sp.]